MGETAAIEKQVENIRTFSDLPICVGFGIKTPEQAKKIAAFSDGVVVGSHFVSQIPQHFDNSKAMVSAMGTAALDMRCAMKQGSA